MAFSRPAIVRVLFIWQTYQIVIADENATVRTRPITHEERRCRSVQFCSRDSSKASRMAPNQQYQPMSG